MMLIILSAATLICYTSATPTSLMTKSSPLVINGTDANIEDFPWMISMRLEGEHNCGGSIVADRWIVTAAHCRGTDIQFGTDKTSIEGPNVIPIRRHHKHENWDIFSLLNDIALLELEEPIPFSRNAQPIKLPPPFFEVEGHWETKATLIGFGYNNVRIFLELFKRKWLK